MAGERIVFGQGFEGLFSREVRALLTPACKDELDRLGVHLDRPFLPGYSVELWAQTVELVARHIYPDETREAAYWKLGRSTVHGFGETLIGKAAFAFMKLTGPVRSVERAARNYANTNNYTVVKLSRTGPTSFDFHLNEQHTIPEFDMGVVEAILEYVGAKHVAVTLVSKDTEGFTMHLEWQ
ncbi:MAG: DUF2378 family protein [Myxococcota bacterium]